MSWHKEWPAVILTLLGIISPLGYLLKLAPVFVFGTYLQTSLWLRPYENSYHFGFNCRYNDAPMQAVVMNPSLRRPTLSIHFSSYLLMVAAPKSYFPLDPFIRREFCHNHDDFTLSAERCAGSPSSVETTSEAIDQLDGTISTLTQVTSCDL